MPKENLFAILFRILEPSHLIKIFRQLCRYVDEITDTAAKRDEFASFAESVTFIFAQMLFGKGIDRYFAPLDMG